MINSQPTALCSVKYKRLKWLNALKLQGWATQCNHSSLLTCYENALNLFFYLVYYFCSGQKLWNLTYSCSPFFFTQNFPEVCYLVPGDYCYWSIPSVGEARQCSGVRPTSCQWLERPTSATTLYRQVTHQVQCSLMRQIIHLHKTFINNTC